MGGPPAVDTRVGFNAYEAGLCSVSRRQLERRGYRLTGAGFGNPESRWGRLGTRMRIPPQHVLESIPRLFPRLSRRVVAYMDV